jgi:hypothetical protein
MPFSIPASELAPAIVAAGLVILGVSSVLQTPRWLTVLRGILARPERYFLGALVEMAAGLLLALSYDRWDGTWPAFTTLLGWLMTIEGALFLVTPGLMQGLNRFSDGFILKFLRFGGIFALILGILLGRFVLTA